MSDEDGISVSEFLMGEFFHTVMERTNTTSRAELHALKKRNPDKFRHHVREALADVTPHCRIFVLNHLRRVAKTVADKTAKSNAAEESHLM